MSELLSIMELVATSELTDKAVIFIVLFILLKLIYKIVIRSIEKIQ